MTCLIRVSYAMVAKPSGISEIYSASCSASGSTEYETGLVFSEIAGARLLRSW